MRNKILYSLLFFAVVIALGLWRWGSCRCTSEVRMTRDVGLFGIDLFGVAHRHLRRREPLYKELDLKTVYTLLPKPLRRWEFVLGKWLGMLLTLAVQMAMMAATLFVVLTLGAASAGRQRQWRRCLRAILLVFGEVAVITAVAVLFSSFSLPICRAR